MVTVLILAIAKTLGGLSVAGMTTEHDKVTGLRWVRPIRERGPVQMADLTTRNHQVLRPFDVVEISLLRHRPVPPLIENWVTDFGDQPRILRHLQGERRQRFLHKYCDPAPQHVLRSQQRSLCLIQARNLTGSFRREANSATVDARLRFRSADRAYGGSYVKGGFSTTDLRWLEMGARWLPEGGGWIEFDGSALETRLGIEEIYLVVSLHYTEQRRFEPVIIGVHSVPEY
ncbi:MAG: hypothetical protein PVI67_10725 [Anaerolineae bacterium]|jgi:hypothetical protein